MSFPSMLTRARGLGLTIDVSKRVRITRANADPGDWEDWEHDRYRVRLTNGRPHAAGYVSLVTVYRKGTGHNGSPPTLEEVLDSLVSDADSAHEPFEDWADNYGLSSDSRKAYATWEACRKTRADLARLVGAENLDKLMYETERL